MRPYCSQICRHIYYRFSWIGRACTVDMSMSMRWMINCWTTHAVHGLSVSTANVFLNRTHHYWPHMPSCCFSSLPVFCNERIRQNKPFVLFPAICWLHAELALVYIILVFARYSDTYQMRFLASDMFLYVHRFISLSNFYFSIWFFLDFSSQLSIPSLEYCWL